MEPHFTYILQSEKDLSYYIGSSNNPEKRLIKHNRPHKGYTARKQPCKLAYTEEYSSKTEALQREFFFESTKIKRVYRKANQK